MGIRIHLYLGFGLTDVKTENGLIVDERFDPEGYFNDKYALRDSFTLDKYKSYLNDQIKFHTTEDEHHRKFNLRLMVQQIEQAKDTHSIYRCMIHDGEFGMSNVLHILLPWMTEWYRYDDAIDYYLLDAATSVPGNATQTDGSNWVKVLNRPIYPWEGYVDARTGERLIGQKHDSMRLIESLRLHAPDSLKFDELFEVFNVPDYDTFKTVIVPMIPDEIIELVQYLRVFKDPKTVYQLRPQIYCCWC